MTQGDDLSLSLLGLVQGWVTNTPDAVAIEAKGESYSYAELDHLSTVIAFSLQKKGIKIDNIS